MAKSIRELAKRFACYYPPRQLRLANPLAFNDPDTLRSYRRAPPIQHCNYDLFLSLPLPPLHPRASETLPAPSLVLEENSIRYRRIDLKEKFDLWNSGLVVIQGGGGIKYDMYIFLLVVVEQRQAERMQTCTRPQSLILMKI